MKNNYIKEFKNLDSIIQEVKFGNNTRFDFLVSKNNKKSFIEVKMLLFLERKNLLNFLMQ